jgi:hypothetical protein
MKHQDPSKQTKRGTSDAPPAAKQKQAQQVRPQDAATKLGIAKEAQEPDAGRGAIDHHQGNHGRRGR